ncbi:hypothetical protein LUU34_00989100 [Aix galericulata]|nr:hypothetical protein LUU34_00989100 [Aix galericulata]
MGAAGALLGVRLVLGRGRSSAGAPRAAGAHPALPAPGESLLLLSHSDLINKKWVTHAEPCSTSPWTSPAVSPSGSGSRRGRRTGTDCPVARCGAWAAPRSRGAPSPPGPAPPAPAGHPPTAEPAAGHSSGGKDARPPRGLGDTSAVAPPAVREGKVRRHRARRLRGFSLPGASTFRGAPTSSQPTSSTLAAVLCGLTCSRSGSAAMALVEALLFPLLPSLRAPTGSRRAFGDKSFLLPSVWDDG